MTPDTWILVKVQNEYGLSDGKKVYCGNYGGYLNGDSWRLSSIIVKAEKLEDKTIFTTASGNQYTCFHSCYGMSSYQERVLDHFNHELENEKLGKIIPVAKEEAI